MLFFKSVKIKKIIKFSFHYSVGYAMYADERFTLNNEKGKYIAEIKLRGIPDEKSTKVEVDEEFEQKLEDILKEYKVDKWDGFQKSDKHVLDGNTFDLSIRMEEDNYIGASGYMKWPKHYKEFKEKVVELFKQYS